MRFTPRWHDTHPIWKWHKWFAWHPVFIKRIGKQVWLEWVYRKRVRTGNLWLGRDPYEFVYEADEVGILQYDAEQEGAGQRTEVKAVYMVYRDVADSGSMVL